MSSILISRKEKFLMYSCGIDSLHTMMSSEGLALQEPQHLRRNLVPFSASSTGLILSKLGPNHPQLVLSDITWNFVNGLSNE
jgi:hypothetical protein